MCIVCVNQGIALLVLRKTPPGVSLVSIGAKNSSITMASAANANLNAVRETMDGTLFNSFFMLQLI